MICEHCGGDIEIRNPSGYCDHLYYPENCKICKPKKLYNEIVLEQLRELEYAIRDGLVYSDTQKAEIVRLCEDIISILN